jgi:hypothetical protein
MRTALSTTAAAAIIVVILIATAGAVFFLASPSSPSGPNVTGWSAGSGCRGVSQGTVYGVPQFVEECVDPSNGSVDLWCIVTLVTQWGGTAISCQPEAKSP